MKSGMGMLSSLILIGMALTIFAVTHITSSFELFAVAQTDTNNNASTTQSANSNTTTLNTNASSGMLDCETIASQLGGQVIPNPAGVCDVTVPMKGLEVVDIPTGTRISQLLVINPIFEFVPVPDANVVNGSNINATGNSTQVPSAVYGFAEIGAPEDRLLSLIDMLANTSWNVVAVHNHVLMESPKMMFVHAVGMADINTLTGDAKSVLDNLNELQQQNGTRTASGSGDVIQQGAEQQSDQPLTPPSATPDPLDS